MAADPFLIGLFGGFYVVPLYALIQLRSALSHRSRIIAANNILNALFMVAAAGLVVIAAGDRRTHGTGDCDAGRPARRGDRLMAGRN